MQPHDRGTAAGVLFPVHWISWRDPDAVVAVFPSDHFIADDAGFMAHVTGLVGFVERHPERIVLVGAQPDSPETGYGWIEPGMELEKSPCSEIRLVQRFWEKPSPEMARASMKRGGLWNTFVMVGRASTLMEVGRLALRRLDERLVRIRPFASIAGEAAAFERAYALAPTANFSQDVLARSQARLAVSRLPAMAWSDWGTPDRVIQTLRREGLAPGWLDRLAPTA